MQPFETAALPPIRFGAGAFAATPELLGGAGHVLIVADAILDKLGVVDLLANRFREKGIAVSRYAGIGGEPREDMVDDIAERARSVQAVVAMGGGAALDAGKLAAAVAGAHRLTADYSLAAQPFPARAQRLVCIPTTAGTGSEVTRTSVVSNLEGAKLWYWGDALRPDAVILDPELTVSLPAAMTAWTGLDAAVHALEAATSRKATPEGRLHGLEALRLLARHLPEAVANGADIAARGKVLWAATQAGIAIENCGTHIGHNISHALGSIAPVHHGLASALGLELALPWLVEGAEPEPFAAAAEALGAARDAAALPAAFSALMRACGVPATLPANCAGLTTEMIAAAMRRPENAPMLAATPRAVADTDIDRLAGATAALART